MAVHSRSFAALDPFEKSLELFSNWNNINFWENFCWIEFLEIEYKKNFFPTSKNIQIRIYNNLIINYSNIQILSPVYFPYRKKKVKKSTFSNVTFRICKTSLLPNWREGGFLLIDDSQTPPPSLQKRKFGIFADSCSTPSKMSRKVISDCGERIFSVYCVTSLGCRCAVRIRVGRCVLHPDGPMCPT